MDELLDPIGRAYREPDLDQTSNRFRTSRQIRLGAPPSIQSRERLGLKPKTHEHSGLGRPLLW